MHAQFIMSHNYENDPAYRKPRIEIAPGSTKATTRSDTENKDSIENFPAIEDPAEDPANKVVHTESQIGSFTEEGISDTVQKVSTSVVLPVKIPGIPEDTQNNNIYCEASLNNSDVFNLFTSPQKVNQELQDNISLNRTIVSVSEDSDDESPFSLATDSLVQEKDMPLDKVPFEKLKTDNWPTWADQCKAYLICNKKWVDPHATSALNDEQIEANKEAGAFVMLAIEIENMALLTEDEKFDFRKTWSKLESVHKPRSQYTVGELLMKITSARHIPGQPINNHLSYMQTQFSYLASIGNPMSDAFQVGLIYTSLFHDPEWGPIVKSGNWSNQDNLNAHKLREILNTSDVAKQEKSALLTPTQTMPNAEIHESRSQESCARYLVVLCLGRVVNRTSYLHRPLKPNTTRYPKP